MKLAKKILLIIFINFIITGNLFSDENFSFTQRLVLLNDSNISNPQKYPNGRIDYNIFGLDPCASDSIDTAYCILDYKTYKEFEIINHPPKPNLSALFKLPDGKGGYYLFSYKDIRGVPDSNKFYKEWYLDVQRGYPGKLTFQWKQLPRDIIDSAYLTDVFPGNIIFKADMLNNTETVVSAEQEFLNKFYIKVWFSKTPNDINETLNESDSYINSFPNPAGDKLYLTAKETVVDYKIYSVYGDVMLAGKLTRTKIEIGLDAIPAGIYFLKMTSKEGRQILRKIIKK